MKPFIAFAGGAAVAGLVVFFLMRDKPADAPKTLPAPVVESRPAPAAPAEPPVETAMPMRAAQPEPTTEPAARKAVDAKPAMAKGASAPAAPAAKASARPAPLSQSVKAAAASKVSDTPAKAPEAPAAATTKAPEASPGLLTFEQAIAASTPQTPAPPAASPEPQRAEIRKPDAMEVKRAKDERAAQTVTIPEGTILNVRINQTLHSDRNENGDVFSAILVEPLVVNGFVIAERGSRLDGRITNAQRAGRVKGTASLSIRLTTLYTADKQRVAIDTEDFIKNAESSAGRETAKVATGAAIGAALGAIFGGGRGAAIGGATGGATGAGTVLMTRGKPAEIGVETRIPFRLRQAVTLTEDLSN